MGADLGHFQKFNLCRTLRSWSLLKRFFVKRRDKTLSPTCRPPERSRHGPQGSVLPRRPGPPGRHQGTTEGCVLGRDHGPHPTAESRERPSPEVERRSHAMMRCRCRAGAARRSPPQRRLWGALPGGRQEAAGTAQPLGLCSFHPSAPDGEEASAAGTPTPARQRQPRSGRALSPPRSARRLRARRNAPAERGPPPAPLLHTKGRRGIVRGRGGWAVWNLPGAAAAGEPP